jgi:uncharacterized membrane protein
MLQLVLQLGKNKIQVFIFVACLHERGLATVMLYHVCSIQQAKLAVAVLIVDCA